MADPRIRMLTIKTGVVKRLTKEKTVYDKEAVQQKTRIEKLKSCGEDEYVLRKQEEVLQEALMMVPDCQRRLGKAVTELDEFLLSEVDLKENGAYEVAVNILSEARLQLVKN